MDDLLGAYRERSLRSDQRMADVLAARGAPGWSEERGTHLKDLFRVPEFQRWHVLLSCYTHGAVVTEMDMWDGEPVPTYVCRNPLTGGQPCNRYMRLERHQADSCDMSPRDGPAFGRKES